MMNPRYCSEVKRALFYDKINYMILCLKACEKVQFDKMIKYIREPSLEIGCANNKTTNLIFGDTVKNITYGCDYFMLDHLFKGSDFYKQRNEVINHHIGAGIPLPFKSNSFQSIVMVHIIDHIDIELWLDDIYRVLRPGGHIIMSGFSKYTFDNFPTVKCRRFFSER